MIMEESLLIEKAADGDLDAFNQLVLTYQELAYNLAYRIMADEAAAADATQDAVISMYRKLNNYRGGSFKAWFLRIVTNACYDELRKQKRRPTITLEPETEEGDLMESPEWIADKSPGLEETMMNTQLEKAIQDCLNNLNEKHRTVMIMVDVSGEDYEAVAEVIQSPVGTVKSRLSRARLKMQECLQNARELLPDQFRLNSEEDDD
ncbi:MAG: sigma-70 family RNA polymerase sigma factor [Chloroflexi bacterium]|jgi:RNA polymerase sigma-70 factor (ECF subfamily)|nr:sigma-70 family RNA polymerase sigma factor [Chloroflexota bacterium]